ncbi:MAG: hypothetical protein EBU20_11780 [Betaproteobacteria bacterium]|nr:hypothetical protein [Betaproteobacteria bacterium]
MDDGHGGAHGGAWKIALADMMTAMMAFFLLMWLLGASNADQRKSIADYFKPTSHSNVTMGKLAGSDGMLGGRSVIDPDGFPFSAKQTSALNMVTPRSEGGPTENDPSPKGADSKESGQDGDPGKKAAEAADKANFDKMEKEIKEAMAKNPKLEKLKDQVSLTPMTATTGLCLRSVPKKPAKSLRRRALQATVLPRSKAWPIRRPTTPTIPKILATGGSASR